MRRRLLLACAAAATAASAQSPDFFGIKFLDKPSDDIRAILHHLAAGRIEKAEHHHRHLAEVAPDLAGQFALRDLEIPCADCAAEKDPACGLCRGTDRFFDPVALDYLAAKFEMALEEQGRSGDRVQELDRSDRRKSSSKKLVDARQKRVRETDAAMAAAAWRQAFEAFASRKRQVLSREVFQGRVVKIEPDGLLVMLAGDEGWIYLDGCNTAGNRAGEIMVGYMWPMQAPTYGYTPPKNGKKIEASRFSANLWRDP